MELNSSTSWEDDIVPGSPIADSLKDLADYGNTILEQLGQKALAFSLDAAVGSPEEQGDYFDN